MTKPYVVLILLGISALSKLFASPLHGVVSMQTPSSQSTNSILELSHQHNLYWLSRTERLSEKSEHVRFQFSGESGNWSPAWQIEHRATTLSGSIDQYDFESRHTDLITGFGFQTPGNHRVLLGPERYGWQWSEGSARSFELGWTAKQHRIQASITDGDQRWRVNGRQVIETLHIELDSENSGFTASLSDRNNWAGHIRFRQLSLELSESFEQWPTLAGEWAGETASLQNFELKHRRYSGYYRTTGNLIKGVGGASQHWSVESQAIFPYEGNPGAVQAHGELATQDIWLDTHLYHWKTRWLIRHAQPSGQGAHYSIYFPGLGERWPEPDIDHAWLLGVNLERTWALPDTDVSLTLWAQQWLPIAIRKASNADDDSQSGSGSPSPGNSSANRHYYGGLQVGFRMSLPI